MSVLAVVRSGVAVPVPVPITVTVPVTVGVRVPAAMFTRVFVSIPRLGALLDRVGPLCEAWSLPRLDPSYLMDLDLGLWRVLNVDIHQGRVERRWTRRHTVYTV